MTFEQIKQKVKNKLDTYKGRLKSAEDKPFMEGKIAGFQEALGLLGQVKYWCEDTPKEAGEYICKGPDINGDTVYFWCSFDGEGFDINADPYSEEIEAWHKIED